MCKKKLHSLNYVSKRRRPSMKFKKINLKEKFFELTMHSGSYKTLIEILKILI